MDGAIALQEQTFSLKSWMTLEGDQGDDSHLLIDTHSGVISSCNDTAWILLSQLKLGASLSHLADILQTHYALSEINARHDALSFLHQLRALECIDEDT